MQAARKQQQGAENGAGRVPEQAIIVQHKLLVQNSCCRTKAARTTTRGPACSEASSTPQVYVACKTRSMLVTKCLLPHQHAPCVAAPASLDPVRWAHCDCHLLPLPHARACSCRVARSAAAPSRPSCSSSMPVAWWASSCRPWPMWQ